jgi:hypothetical protein
MPVQSYPQAYRDSAADRLYVCPGCNTAQHGPYAGGPVHCAQCRAPYTLPDRSALFARPSDVPLPNDAPVRIAQLRAQDGRPRVPSASLAAVLGGPNVQPGHEQEALLVWQNLRARAAQGDVAASEDLAFLMLLLAQLPVVQQQTELVTAFRESTYDAAVLPRHKQEQLGALVRGAVARGDRAAAQRYLSWMAPSAPELEADSEFRVSSAIVATMDRDATKVLALLGPQKDAIPIADSMDPMASVFRANGHEMLGNVAAAQQVLRELPGPDVLDLVRKRFERMPICPQSAPAYVASANDAAARRAASSAGRVGRLIGGILALVGLVEGGVGIAVAVGVSDFTNPAIFVNGGLGIVLFCIGVTIFLMARRKGKHAAWLRVSGLSLTARIMDAQMTGTRINNVPVFRFVLQVAGPQGPYAASFTKLVPSHQVATLVGSPVRVRANPSKLDDVILEE